MIRLTTNVLGVFAVKNGRIINKTLFKGGPEQVAAKLAAAVDSVCEEELKLLGELAATGVKKMAVNKPSRFWGNKLDVEFIEDSEKPLDALHLAAELGFSEKHVQELIRDVNLRLTREKLKVVEKDQVLMQAVSALDDIEEVSNRLVERLREWYSIHYPELNHIVEKHETYVQLVRDFGLRKNYSKEKLNVEPEFRDRILDGASNSVGSEFTGRDMEVVNSIAVALSSLYATQSAVEDYLTFLTGEIAPNISALVGPLLGARLIKLSNGLKRMATLPASTIQILGAEDAFFRFLKTGKRPPKHGVIFQYPEIKNSPKEIRGKLARTLASKLSIAAKLDAYGGEFMGDKLSEGFMNRVKALKK